jgi:hypothetical protein
MKTFVEDLTEVNGETRYGPTETELIGCACGAKKDESCGAWVCGCVDTVQKEA